MAERRRRWALRAALLVTAAVVLVACSDSEGEREVLTGAKVAVPEGDTSIQLPTGRATFAVGEAATLDEGDVDGADDSASGAYVAVTWEWAPGEGIPAGLLGHLTGGKDEATVAVTAAGREFDLGTVSAAGDDPGSSVTHYVPVADGVGPGDVTIEVALSGVAQTVRGDGSALEPGRAAGLYDLPESDSKAACELTWSVGRSAPVDCGASTVRLPYLAKLGWADEGSSWLVANVFVGAVSFPDGPDRTEVTDQTETLTVAGTGPAEVLANDKGTHGELSTLSVFSVPQSGPATIEVQREVRPAAADGSPVRLTGQVVEAG